jgi:excisionase family DNA binding protein
MSQLSCKNEVKSMSKKQRNLISLDKIILHLGITAEQWMASRYSTNAMPIANNYYWDVPDLLKRMKIDAPDFPKFWTKANEVAWLLDKSADTILRWARQKKIRSWKFGDHTYRFHNNFLTVKKVGKQ